jgi:two-component system LytT family sensor kinase
MRPTAAAALEKLIIVMVFAAAFFGILYHPTLPVFINEFNTVDGSAYAARSFDWLIALIVFMTAAFYLVPAQLEKRRFLRFAALSLVGIALISLLHHQLHLVVLRLFNLPTGPEEISDKMITYYRRKSYDFPILPANLVIYTLGVLYGMSRDWIRKSRIETRLVQEKMKADIDLLRSQINPHFFFNALNNIYAISQRNEEEETGEAIMKLSGLMRHMIYDSSAAAIGLDRELEHVKNFIDVARLRFAEDENVDIALREQGDFHAFKIAPLILIPFVENAFKHGLGSRGEGFIHINIEAQDGELRFEIQNPILDKGESLQKHSGIGLDNVRKRLRLLYPDRHTLDIAADEGLFDVRLSIRIKE